eukprot:scaffold22926_cov90-Isochrysis_galbana.AAC.1
MPTRQDLPMIWGDHHVRWEYICAEDPGCSAGGRGLAYPPCRTRSMRARQPCARRERGGRGRACFSCGGEGLE